jgi:hypothetical protein
MKGRLDHAADEDYIGSGHQGGCWGVADAIAGRTYADKRAEQYQRYHGPLGMYARGHII